MHFKQILSAALTAAVLIGSGIPSVTASEAETTLYYGGGSLSVTADPTGSGRGNVFDINGYDTYRGTDVEKGNNPYIEIPNTYLYDYSDGVYTLKDDFSVSLDVYIKSQGYRYAFYTGSDDYYGGNTGMHGLYLIPDTGSSNYIEGRTPSETTLYAASEEYTALKMSWHNIEFTRNGGAFTVLLDGEEWISAADSDYAYSIEREPVVRIGYTPYSSDGGASMYADNILIKNGGETVYEDTADGEYNIITEGVSTEREVVINSVSDGSETQKLIDAFYDTEPRRMEALDRGLVAVEAGDYGFISWRWLGTESADVKYNLYKNGEKLNSEPLNVTNYVDYSAKSGDVYSVAAVTDGVEGEHCAEVGFNENEYLEIPLTPPDGGSVTQSDGTVETYTYSANDAAAGDLDGDGEYELVIKWEPSDAKDSSNAGKTGNTIFDAYDLDGTRLWRIDMGVNIRSGPHDTQFIVGDFNADGKSEVAMRTADGTVAGDGTLIGTTDDWRDDNGKNLTGALYLTVFDGETGAILDSVDYAPLSQGDYDGKEWDISSWGDGWGNRSERYLAGMAYLQSDRPSMIFSRGYYDRTAIGAWTMTDDNEIELTWLYDTYMYDDADTANYRGQGNHSMSIADVDYDGRDEIIFGAMALDDDGTVMYSTALGHGDAQHVADLIPERPGLEVYSVHEGGNDAFDMRDARTGEIIWEIERGKDDVGRGAAADIDPYYDGAESWSADQKLMTAGGEVIAEQYSIPANFLCWWDGDLGREVQDSINIYKYNHFTNKVDTIFTADGCHSNNSAKSNPSLTADILGDWREEVIYPTMDNTALRIYTTTTPTSYRIPTLMHDARYRAQAAGENVCYNQPTHVGYDLSYTTESVPVPNIYTVVDGEIVTNPDLDKENWSIDALYDGDTVEMTTDSSVALVNGEPYTITSGDAEIQPIIRNDRTMVPVRFISEAFGANVEWDGGAQSVTVTTPDAEVKLTIGSAEYTVNGTQKTMDSEAFIESDATFIPLRAVAESLGYNVEWNSGAIAVSDKDIEIDDEYRAEIYAKIAEAAENIEPEAAESVWQVGESYLAGQSAVLDVLETGHNGDHSAALAVDCDFDTYTETTGRQIIQLELDGYWAISAVAITFADNEEHNFKVYTKWSLDETYDGNLENLDGWGEAITTSRFGTDTEPVLYIFPVPKYGKYVKIILDENNTGDTVPISEIAVIKVI
ncbi:MAG: hypothetical protein LUD03_00625 [Firmicutes bacterium]|nr:hypothetical protein [Bacillota bacterium]